MYVPSGDRFTLRFASDRLYADSKATPIDLGFDDDARANTSVLFDGCWTRGTAVGYAIARATTSRLVMIADFLY